jgi:WD40 repeat protein
MSSPEYRRELEVYVDGNDSSFPRRLRHREGASMDDEVFDLIKAHMAKCRTFVLFVGPQSAQHPWINRELEHWLDTYPTRDFLIAVTHGEAPQSESERTFPARVVKDELHKRLWIDLRGFRHRKKDGKVLSLRGYEEERLRLAAALMGPDVSVAHLVEGWRRADAKRRRRNRILGALAGTVLLGSAAGLVAALAARQESAREARASSLALVSRQSSGQDANRRLDGLAFAASSLMEQPTPLGYSSLIEAAQPLPRHLRSIVHDRGGKAVDVVRFLDHDRIVASAGYTGVLQLTAADSGKVLGRVELTSRANALAVHPDLPLLAVATRRGLDLVSYQPGAADPAPRITGRWRSAESFQGVVFEPGGKTLIAGGTDGTLARFRLADATPDSWEPVETLKLADPDGAKTVVFGLALDAGARRLAVADILGTIRCLDADHWERPAKTAEHSSEIFGMASSPDGRLAVAADADGGYVFFRPADCALLDRVASPVTQDSVARGFDGHLRSAPRLERAHTGIAFSADGSLIGVASHDRTVRIDTVDRHASAYIVVHQAMTRSVSFSADGTRVATGSDDGRIEIWEMGSSVETRRIGGVDALAVDPQGQWAAAWSDDGALQLLDPATGRVIARGRVPDDDEFRRSVSHLSPSPDRKTLAVRAMGSTRVLAWDVSNPGRRDLAPPRFLQHPNVAGHVAMVRGMAPGPGSAELVTAEGYQGRSVRLWDLARGIGKEVATLEGEATAVATGHGLIAAADATGLVRVISPDGKRIGDLRLPGTPKALAVSPDGRTLFASFLGKESRGNCLCRMDGELETGSWPSSLGHPAPPATPGCHGAAGRLRCRGLLSGTSAPHALFTPQSDTLAVATTGASLDLGDLFLLQAGDGWQPRLLSSAGEVYALDFTLDGALLAAGGPSRSVEIFDVETARKAAEIPLPNPVRDLRFIPGPQNRLLTLDGAEVGFLRLWDWRREALVRAACARWPESYAPLPNPALPQLRSRGEICGARRESP